MNINDEIKKKTEYCLNCKMKPCSNKGCPLNNDIPAFIKNIKENNIEEAYKILTKTTVLPAICGRICPHDKQCQGMCIRGTKNEPVSIGDLETFVGDYALKNNIKIVNDEENIKFPNLSKQQNLVRNSKIAIIGGGTAGLTAAAFLARKNVDVTIYEKYDCLGGLLIHGIPDFRLEKQIVKKTVEQILELGVKVKYKQELGNNLKLDELLKKYDYIYLSIGANVSSKMGIEGEKLSGVYGGNELLEYKKHPNYEGKKVIVNGGGNVAMDTARTIKRLGAKEVTVVYRRAREQMPAENKEIEDAMNEEIKFLFKHNIVKINGNEKVTGIEVIKTDLVKKEGDTRLSPINIEGSNYNIDADYVVMALGARTEEYVKNLGLELDGKGYIKVDENGRTSNLKIFAGGDVSSSGRGTVAWAARQGRDAAEKIWDLFQNMK